MSNLKTPKFRVSYPAVFKSKFNDMSKKEEFSVVAVFPKGTNFDEMKAKAQEAAKKKWGDKIPANLKTPFRDQAEREKDGQMPAGYEKGAIFMNLKSSSKPAIVGGKMDPVTKTLNEITEEKDFYAGCWAIAAVQAYAYDKNGNRGISFGLISLQKVAEGEALTANAVKPSDDFSPIEDIETGASTTDIFK